MTSARRIAGFALQVVPDEIAGYAEPFLDGGAIAIAVLTAHPAVPAVLVSENTALIEVWQVVRDDVDGLVGALRRLAERHSPSFFAGVRDRDLAPSSAASLSPAERAARYVYLRGTARPDARGEPPRVVTPVVGDRAASGGDEAVPRPLVEYGRDAVPVDEAGLRALARLLGERDVEIAVRAPFELLPQLREDDLLWLDASSAAADGADAADPAVTRRRERELRSFVGSAVARGVGVLAPAHPLLASARELSPLPEPAPDVSLLGSAALRRALPR